MSDSGALLMRAIGDELTLRIIPELKSADAIERAALSQLVLQYLVADIAVLPAVAEQLAPEFRQLIDASLRSVPAGPLRGPADQYQAELKRIPVEDGYVREREIAALRTLAGRIVRELTDHVSKPETQASAAVIEPILTQLGSVDFRWLTAYETARIEHVKAAAKPFTPEAPAAIPAITAESATRYLRARFPADPQIEATAVVPIPGGRSKKTFFITIRGTSALPADVVMRQDYALRYEGTKVRDEYQPLARLAEFGLPVPKPLHLEAQESELGPPFILVERLRGSAPGSYFGLQSPCPGAFRDLARMLAQLHRVDPAELGFKVGPDPERSLEQLIGQYEKKWRDNAVKPSPLIDYAYSWARRECAREPGIACVTHGDCGPYNVLVQDDRLMAVLDWEFAHVGDPAEDLGIVRVYAEGVMSWDEFMSIYTAAGGQPIPERRIRLSMVLQFLKGTTLVAASGRNFEEGWTKEFIKGATSFTGLRMIEQRIATLLQRFDAIEERVAG
ncbi:MAG TPA: phosphotransferase family protein [Steroidobacteraceae bacterium]|nr:phosphotransferase family protein [Steroidobacteraceae bacterium]